MARAAKLKVFRTAIGFHDAYVAAASRKAALEAWGSDKDLFARGMAEQVTDEALMAEPLASPGKVIRRLRGTAEQQIAALPADRPKKAARAKETAAALPGDEPDAPDRTAPPSGPRSTSQPKAKPKPRPSRAALDRAEKAVAAAERRHAGEIEDLRRREQALVHDRHRLQALQEKRLRALEAAQDKAQQAYRDALAQWAEQA